MPAGYNKTVFTLTELVAISIVWSSASFVTKALIKDGLSSAAAAAGITGYLSDVIVCAVLVLMLYIMILLFKDLTVGSSRPWQLKIPGGEGDPVTDDEAISAIRDLKYYIELAKERRKTDPTSWSTENENLIDDPAFMDAIKEQENNRLLRLVSGDKRSSSKINRLLSRSYRQYQDFYVINNTPGP